MMAHDPEMLSEEEATRLWGRAAQLQAEAGGDVPAPTVGAEGIGAPLRQYALTEVRSAASEAGIADQFVEAALADIRVGRLHGDERRGGALARRFLNHPPDTITIQRVVDASPQKVLSAMEAVFTSESFRLTLTDQQGDPLDGGMLVFAMPGMRTPFERGFAFEASDAGLKQMFVSLRPVDEPIGGCEITVQSPVTSHNIGLGLGMFVTTVSGGVGLGGLGAIALALGTGPVGVIGGVLLGAGLGAGLGVKGFRALYHFSMRRATRALNGLVGAVAARAKGTWQA